MEKKSQEILILKQNNIALKDKLTVNQKLIIQLKEKSYQKEKRIKTNLNYT